MYELITRARAIYNLDNRSTTSAENDLLDALVTAVSQAVESWCGRLFAERRCDELYDGVRHTELLLQHYPVVSVERIAYNPASVLRVTNTAAGNQRAGVQVSDTGLSLTRVASGVITTSTLTFAGNVTLSALATAITALGNGWSAALTRSEYADFASADLRALQGAYGAKDVAAELKMHVADLTDFDIDRDRGVLTRCGGAAHWDGGPGWWRVIYYAGYATIPDDVQEACAQWVAALFWQAKRDPGLAQESIPAALARTPLQDLPASVRILLRPYRTVRV